MAVEPNIDHLEGYRGASLVSHNPLSSSWIAESDRPPHRVFVKTNTPDSEIPIEQQISILNDSYRRQRRLKCGKLVTARTMRRVDTRVQIVYSYLNRDIWSPVSSSGPPEDVIPVVSEMALILDFLHSRGLVHCDVKLDNFMARQTPSGPELILTDLEFLSRDGQDLQARLIGAPAHIAPEIVRNDRVDIRSDNYSLGVAIRLLINDSEGLAEKTRKALQTLVDYLTEEDYRERPACLINALCRCGAVDEAGLESLRRKLWSMQLTDSLRNARSRAERGSLSLTKIFQNNNICGLSGDFLSHLDEIARLRPHRAIRTLRRLADSGRLDYDGQFWTLTVNDVRLLEAYGALDNQVAELQAQIKAGRPDETAIRGLVRDLNAVNRPEPAFLLLCTVVRPERGDPDVGLFVKLARDLGRSLDLIKFLERYVGDRKDFNVAEVEHIYDLAKELLVVRRGGEAEHYIEIGLKSAERLQNRSMAIKFRTYLGLCHTMDGRLETGLRILSEAEEEARIMGLADEEIAASYVLSQQTTRSDDYVERERSLLRVEKRAAAIGSTLQAVAIYSTLSRLTYEQALYNRSLKFCKAAIKAAGKGQGRSRVTSPYNSLINTYSRLGEYGSALHWLEEVRVMSLLQDSRLNHYLSQLNLADLEMTRGRLRRAESILLPLVDPGDGSVDLRSQGLVLQNLGEIAALRGEYRSAEKYLNRADEKYRQSQSGDHLLRTRSLRLIARLPEDIGHNLGAWKDCLHGLREAHLYFHFGRLLCYVMLYAEGHELGDLLRLAEPVRKVFSSSGAPVLKAALEMLDGVGAEPDRPGVGLRGLKEAYKILMKAKQFDLSGRICELLAERYRDTGNPRLSRKFFQQAAAIIRPLDNKRWQAQLREKIADVGQPDADRSRLVDSFAGISDIVRHVGDAPRALSRLVRFAAEVTGAERAVLMVRGGADSSLRAIASYDCDEPSIRDVVNISSSVSMEVFKSDDPVLIDEAMIDPRTKRYKSIVRHNIQSVACVPLPSEAGPAGVLYLDHHTIPALFDETDFVYIKAMANFVSHALSAINRYRAVTTMNRELADRRRCENGEANVFIGESDEARKLLENLPAIAGSDVPVLLLGESGTGKEVIANIIHEYSPRRKGPLLTVNSSAIMLTTAEAELFGVEKRFATEVDRRNGKVADAEGGTLFFDEIADMPPAIQAKILRVVDTNQFTPLGANLELLADVRFVFATNANLEEKVRAGLFREDLLFRINTLVIEIPPLRKRLSDIPLLVDHFLTLKAKRGRKPKVHPKFLDVLMNYSWPGNVRALKNVLDKLLIFHPGEELTADLLDKPILEEYRLSNKAPDEAEEARAMRDALAQTGGNRSKAARLMRMPRATFYRKMKKYGLR